MPVAISGMHRSGTSMIARVLNLCGLYLGAPAELVGPGRGNSEGHWENLEVIRINDAILAAHAAGWDLLPAKSPGWGADALHEVRAQAQMLIERYSRFEPWGWKDPRTCLTLSCWQELIPRLMIVVPVRDPLEVADSLHRRNVSSVPFSLNLWTGYHRALLAVTTPDTRVVTSYDSFMERPVAETKRILGKLGLPAPEGVIFAACSSVDPSLRHFSNAASAAKDGYLSSEAKELYDTLLAETGDPAPRTAEASAPRRSEPFNPVMSTRLAAGKASRLVLGRALGLNRLVERQDRRLREVEAQLACRIRQERAGYDGRHSPEDTSTERSD